MKGLMSKGLVLLFLLHWGNGSRRSKRGFGGYADILGQRELTFDYLNQNQNIALWSAQSAVTSSVGQVYGHQQAQLADAVRDFVTPKQTHHHHPHHHDGQRSHYSKPSRYQAPYNVELEKTENSVHHSPPSHQRSLGYSKKKTGPWRPVKNQRRQRRPHRHSVSNKY